MIKVGIFKIDYKKIDCKNGKTRLKKVYIFIQELTTDNLLEVYKIYPFFNNFYICEFDNGYYYFNSSKRRIALTTEKFIEQF